MMKSLEAPLFSPLAIAPMIDWSDTHFRMLMRLLAPKALVYTEMKTTNAIHYQPGRTLHFHPAETPVALQLGGSDPSALATAAKQGEAAGFSEINLNLGCPSSRVLAGQFGASLMCNPVRVAECIQAMKEVVSIPVTAKTRIGINKEDSYAFFEAFVHVLVESGCDKLIVHARKAWLKGLNPKQNRTIPPLHYDYVHRIKTSLPTHIPVVINGQVEDIDAIKTHLKTLDGVMIGRLACRDPYAIASIHHALYPTIPKPSRTAVLEAYFAYAASEKTPIHHLLKPILNLVHGLPHARAFKQTLLQLKNIQDTAAICELTQHLGHMEQSLDGLFA
ncbi:MAG: tRNA dihydrouridine(20/20a) synthase DusA [Gammaproteobacteria bacterium]|nr:tRNA dihydrouridine(20/20a) synthase DusA [Gammaproteobacteria bacterium]